MTLLRKYPKEDYVIGQLFINGKFFCNTLEDTDRELYQGMGDAEIRKIKVYGQTAVPFGRYQVTLKIQSPKYSKRKQYEFCKGYLPRLLDVPGFDGILLHIGNTEKDTEGCILVGMNTVKGKVMQSTETFKKLYAILKEADEKGEKIYITIQPA